MVSLSLSRFFFLSVFFFLSLTGLTNIFLSYTLYARSYRILVAHDIRETDLYKPTGFFRNPYLQCIVIVNVYRLYMKKIK